MCLSSRMIMAIQNTDRFMVSNVSSLLADCCLDVWRERNQTTSWSVVRGCTRRWMTICKELMSDDSPLLFTGKIAAVGDWAQDTYYRCRKELNFDFCTLFILFRILVLCWWRDVHLPRLYLSWHCRHTTAGSGEKHQCLRTLLKAATCYIN